MVKVLISDKLDPLAVEIFEKNGIFMTENPSQALHMPKINKISKTARNIAI